MKINSETSNYNNTSFKSMKMSALSNILYTLGNNDMLNAAAIDIAAMDTPRTIIETKNRGKNAGIEMGFREYTGTFISEFSAVLFASIISKLMSKKYKPDIKVNSNSWATNRVLDTFSEIYKNSDKTPIGFVSDSLSAIEGVAGNKIKKFSSPKESASIAASITDIITNPNISKKETKTALKNIQNDIIEVLGADNNIIVKSGNNTCSANLSHTLRDIIDLGKNVFFKKNGSNISEIINKLKKINNSRIMIAIPASMLLASTNQYINRRLTKKRTGIDNFVGENGYEKNVETHNEREKEKGLTVKKMLSAGIFLLMLTKVMGIKKPSDLINKLEFNGPATSGNTIKTIYGTLILGRIFAAKDSTELRETNVRDYLGFLNWLVLGGFVAKGAAQVFDPKQENLFNITKQGKGISHWLKDVSLKSQKEVIAQGGNIAKNLKHLNISQLAGIAYSALMLGVLLPKLNIAMTRKKSNAVFSQNLTNIFDENSFEKFDEKISKNI